MNKKLSVPLSPPEITWGLAYFAFQLLVLPSVLLGLNGVLASPLPGPELNFLYYSLNFIAVILLFRGFLARSAAQALKHPALFCQAVILGLAACLACRQITQALIRHLLPSFTNYNDSAIAQLSRSNSILMTVGTALLVPPAEECFYRGLLFRWLWEKSHWGAYLVSVTAFAALHMIGYLNVYSLPELAVAAAQYLPAGLCLAWCYTKADTIFAPILVHGLLNFLTIRTMR